MEEHRAVRSYVRREGRVTRAQTRALEELLPRFGIEFDDEAIDLDAVFGRDAPRVLEIGFGDGGALAELAAAHPDHDFLGIEVHRPGVGHLLLDVEARGLSNVRVISHDAVEVLHCLPEHSLSRVNIWFPDPWPKKRHHKRRLIQPALVALVATRMQPDGILHLATDWEAYALHMQEVMGDSKDFLTAQTPGDGASEGIGPRPETKYERRGTRLGHGVWDLVYRRDA